LGSCARNNVGRGLQADEHLLVGRRVALAAAAADDQMRARQQIGITRDFRVFEREAGRMHPVMHIGAHGALIALFGDGAAEIEIPDGVDGVGLQALAIGPAGVLPLR
jgi:hypothetical protein